MSEPNNLNYGENNNFVSNNNQQELQNANFSLLPNSEQYTVTPYNEEPQMQQGQYYTPPQINNVYNQQITPQTNNNIYLNNTPSNNLVLNNQNLSQRRKTSQIILIILLYLSSIYNIIDSLARRVNSLILINLIISILQIILASVILFYTIKNKSSRSICTSIISIFIWILDGVYFILKIIIGLSDTIINFALIILIISFDIFIFIFNTNCNYFKCFD